MSLKRIGPITVETGPGQPATDKHPSRSPIYRNAAGAERMPDSLNGATTLYELFQQSAEAHADRSCVGWRPVDASGAIGAYNFLTYRQVQSKARELASAFVAAGISPGSSAKVGVFAPNRLEWMLCIRAVDLLGLTIVPIYDSLGEAAVEYICNHSELSLAFVDPGKLAKFAEAAPKVAKHVRTIVCFGHVATESSEAIKKAGIDIVAWDDFIASGSGVELKVSPPKPDDLALLMYTSGTTGEKRMRTTTKAKLRRSLSCTCTAK
jgi:long-chain acyl-CoA synthetase